MKTFAKIFVSCTLLLSSASCGEWLDVMPQGMTTEENLFSDYSGYRSALNGIYQQMASPSLYGRELSWGFVSALSQYYDFGSMDASQIYAYTEKMDYENKEVLDFLESIWQTAYNTIANCNALISHVEKADPDLFPYAESGEREMIYRESAGSPRPAAFRAAAALRCGPRRGSHGQGDSLFDNLSRQGSGALYDRGGARKDHRRFRGGASAAGRQRPESGCTQDGLPCVFVSNDSRGLFFGFRGTRLHYWAVKALLARVYMYACDYEKALAAATEVYDACSSWFPLTDYSTASKVQGAVKLYDDIIFAAYDQYLTKNYNDVMLSNQNNFILALRNPKKRFTATEQKYDVRYRYCVNQPDAEGQEDVYTSCRVREIYRYHRFRL